MSYCPHCGEPIKITAAKRSRVPSKITPPAVLLILEQEAAAAGIGIPVLTGIDRRRHVYIARYRCMVRLRAMGRSLPTIGRILNRDHTTVLAALNKGPVYPGMEVPE